MNKTFDQGREEVSRLCEFFATNKHSFLASGVKEAHVRQNLIDPLFVALGWDVSNAAMTAPQYREVVTEDSLDVEGHQKAPDYTFRVGTLPKFYCEAKKCGVNINLNPAPAYQLRRYGWSARVALSVLTDFEELGVYDCTSRPRPNDKASHARIQYFHFEEFPDRWREIWSVFSREAVWAGGFDQYAASKRKHGTSEVDVEFLKEIEGWRDELARNIALRNADLSSDDLNAAVQRTIDRVVFLRMAEDRGLEPYAQLLKLGEGEDAYSRFMAELCRRSDEKYNSGLFHFQKESGTAEAADRITPKLTVDDKVFKSILKSLYFEHGSPYHFGVLPVEILGTVYERFLGKVIRLTPGHQAKIEEKPEVRKAGGVYYTPAYVVDYIVEHTVAERIEGRSPTNLAGGNTKSPFRVLDMACGSGSFLLGAYQRILDHCLKWYVEHNPETNKKAVYRDSSGQWRLTIAERKRILTSHIHGVDIDPQAVEVSKLSLLLKALEGENDASLSRQFMLFHDRALPNLVGNIRCGNSLINPDYFSGKGLPDVEELRRVKPFDWEAEFPDAMRLGGFDCVIGNPPWGGDIDRDLEYFHSKYPATTQEHTDSYKLFIEQSIHLANDGGLASMIVPSTLLRQRRLKDVRSLMLQYQIVALVDLGEDVFSGVVAPSCIFVIKKGKPANSHQVHTLNARELPEHKRIEALRNGCRAEKLIKQNAFQTNPDLEFSDAPKMSNVPVVFLGDFEVECKDAGINYQRVNVGMQEKGKSDLSDRLLYEGKRQKAKDKMFWKGTDINRYWIAEATERFCRPNYSDFLRADEVVHLNETVYETTPKILLRQTADHIVATIDYRGVWFGRSIIAIVSAPKSRYRMEYTLGLLNSRYFDWLYRRLVQETGRVFAQVKLSKIKQLPVRAIDFSIPADAARHDQIVMYVEQMISLNRQLANTESDLQKQLLNHQIERTDRKIDRLVYELYSLTAGEIAIVEKGG